jgi:phosphoribosylformylglycinamidine synthase
MEYSVFVEVSLRPGIADPEGATIERALPALGFAGVSRVRAGKAFRLSIEAENESEALAAAKSLADRLLSNPVIEHAEVSLSDVTK